MYFETMIKMAQDIAAAQQQYGGFSPEDTICVICSGSGRYFTGVSQMQNFNGQMMYVHAEINACGQMMQTGEFAVAALMVVNAVNLSAMLPCSGCINYILSQDPSNVNCQIVLPDQLMPIMAVGGTQNGQDLITEAAPAPVEATNKNSSSDLLRSRVDSLMHIDDDDDEEEEKPQNKSFFGKLFGRK